MEKLIRLGMLMGLMFFAFVGVIGLLTQDFKTEQVIFLLTMVIGSVVIAKLMVKEGQL
jgi:hypothetical protein